jgi:hypothetical protein
VTSGGRSGALAAPGAREDPPARSGPEAAALPSGEASPDPRASAVARAAVRRALPPSAAPPVIAADLTGCARSRAPLGVVNREPVASSAEHPPNPVTRGTGRDSQGSFTLRVDCQAWCGIQVLCWLCASRRRYRGCRHWIGKCPREREDMREHDQCRRVAPHARPECVALARPSSTGRTRNTRWMLVNQTRAATLIAEGQCK